MALDGDATFTLQVHVVQDLILHILGFYRFGIFQQTVGKRTLPVVNMSNNTEIADILHLLQLF